MPFKLFWEDPNLGEDGHRLYRDTVTIDPNSPPTEIADLGVNVEAYDDLDVSLVDSTTYYYRVSAYVPTSEKFSDEVVEVAESNNPIAGKVVIHFEMDSVTGTTLDSNAILGIGADLINGANITTFGATGNALSLNGVDQYAILYPPKEDASTYPEISLGCWFNITGPKNQILMSYDRSEFYRLEIGGDTGIADSGSLGIGFCISGAADYSEIALAGDDLVDGEWHLAIFTFDNGVAKLYLDGVLGQEVDYGIGLELGQCVPSAGGPRFGTIGVGSEFELNNGTEDPLPADYVNGLITKVFEMHRVMSPEEIAHMYIRGPEA